jgi:hypothetical protein
MAFGKKAMRLKTPGDKAAGGTLDTGSTGPTDVCLSVK